MEPNNGPEFDLALENAKALMAQQNALMNHHPVMTVTTTTRPNGETTTVISIGQPGQMQEPRPNLMYDYPANPDMEVIRLMGAAYGDGKRIPLSEDDEGYEEKKEALKKSGRRWNGEVWVRK